MNSQRELIYRRRHNALFGERLQLDIMNMIFDVSEDVVNSTKPSENYDSFKLTTLSILSVDYNISREDFNKISIEELSRKLYDEAYRHYKQKNQEIATKSFPIMQDIHKTRGATVEEVLVPFTDGKKQIGVATNLRKNIETNGRELIRSVEKYSTLAIIDHAWKEHLREMDDLKQSVQAAVYEQKDPLLIYKFEAFELFKRFVAKLNEDTIGFLMKAVIPVRDPSEVREAQHRRQQQQQRLKESKEESRSALAGKSAPGAETRNRPPAEKVVPVKSDKIAGRNDRVSVQYSDGSIKENVKFKTVEEDIKNNLCVLIDQTRKK
jgi:preprotein translocase subunit SecA